MRLLDRYIAKQVFISAAFAVAVIIIILVLGNVFKEILRELAKRPDLSLGFVLKFIALVIPISLSLAIPFSFLTAILLTFGRLSADSEFVSMRMAGLSMGRICLPVGVLALFFTVICAWVNLSITPAAKTEMEGMKASLINLIKREPMLLFPDRQVMTELQDHLVFANKEEDRLSSFQMIKLEGGLPQALVVASEAEVSVDLEKSEPELILDLYEMNLLVKGEGGDFMGFSQPVYFDEARAGVPIRGLAQSGDDVRDQPENISLRRLFGKIADRELEDEMRTTYRTELSMRMAFSVSCITFALIGVPLGITAQRRESSAGFVISMLIAVTYYVMLTMAQLTRTNEAMYPHLLVWVPNVLFFCLGLLLFRRLSKS
ncbi:MAG: LptF/LptG family permease [Verrucomicrobiota bacterium]